MSIDLEVARHAMVEQQVRPWDVVDPLVLDALSRVRREEFVPPRQRRLAFADVALPLEHGELMFKPLLDGRILQTLQLAPEHEVLEIGTGTGFLTACLAHIARAVHSIDLHADFVERARARLENLGLSCARVEQGDLFNFNPGRQFDAVLLGGGVAEVPPAAFAWVREGGRLFAVRGHSPAMEAVVFTRLPGGAFSQHSVFETDLPYLRGAEPKARFVL